MKWLGIWIIALGIFSVICAIHATKLERRGITHKDAIKRSGDALTGFTLVFSIIEFGVFLMTR